MKFISATLAILLLCISGAFTYFWYQTNQTVKQAISALAPYAQISYGSIISSVYPGILGIADVDVIVEGKRLHADAITFRAGTIFDLYALQKNPHSYALSQPRLDIRGLQSPAPASDFNRLVDTFDHRYLRTIRNLDALGCNNRDRISLADMTAMGYRGLQGDFSLWSKPQPFSNGYLVELSSSLPGRADYRLTVSLPDTPGDFSQLAHKLSRLELDSISLTSRDRGYNERLQEFCAAELGTDPDSYQRIHLAAVEQFFRRQGIHLGDDELAIYREGLHRGASKQLRVKPRRGFAIEDLRFYQPDDYRELLGIHFSANNRAAARQDKSSHLATTPAADNQVATRNDSLSQRQQREILGWEDLDQALHRRVIVFTASGGRHRGRVEQINPGELVLKKSFGPDSMTFTIDRKRFSRAALVN